MVARKSLTAHLAKTFWEEFKRDPPDWPPPLAASNPGTFSSHQRSLLIFIDFLFVYFPSRSGRVWVSDTPRLASSFGSSSESGNSIGARTRDPIANYDDLEPSYIPSRGDQGQGQARGFEARKRDSGRLRAGSQRQLSLCRRVTQCGTEC